MISKLFSLVRSHYMLCKLQTSVLNLADPVMDELFIYQAELLTLKAATFFLHVPTVRFW